MEHTSAIQNPKSEIRNPKSEIAQLLRLAAPFTGWMILAVLLGTATVGSGIGLMATSAWIIASAALRPSIADLQVAIVGVRFFGIARGVFRYLERYVSHHVTFRLLARLRVWFYQAIEPLAPARLMRASRHSGDLLARSVADIETLEHFYVRVIAPPAAALLIGLLMWFFMRGFDWRLAAALLAIYMIAGAGVPLLTRQLSRRVGRRMVTARSELNVALVDSIQGVADVVAFRQEAAQLQRVKTWSLELVGLQARMAWVSGLHGALGSLLTSLAALAVLVIAIPLVSAARMPGVYLPVLVLAAMASFEAVQPLSQAAQYLESALEAARRLFDIVDTQPILIHEEHKGPQRILDVPLGPLWKKDAPPDLSPALPVPFTLRPAFCILPLASCVLRLENLRFRYAPDEPWALDGISFTLPPGGRLAIVGPSGAGKTTLINLLLRFWDYEEGVITLGERDLRECDADDVRRTMGVVSQNAFLFNATVRDNLLLAKPDATQAELERAAQSAQLHPFIQSLPQGYDTWIGEQGLRLSGGERQRLAIARALLKDAPILILDEPTANLDTLTERGVLRSIHKLMEGRATLIVTHRLVGLDVADEILALRSGRLVERGRQDELLQMNGLYRRMWEQQRLS